MISALGLHAASIAGMAWAVLAATFETADTAPGREGMPGEMEPVPDN